KLEYLPAEVQTWLLTAGGFAAFALAIWVLVRLLRGPGPNRDERYGSGPSYVVAIAVVGLLIMLLPAILQYAWNALGWIGSSTTTAGKSPLQETFAAQEKYVVFPYEGVLLQFGAGCALAAVLLPVAINLSRLRLRRIGALAKLSFKEAVRRRVLLVFFFVLLPVFLFSPWFIEDKPEYQLRTYVQTVYTAMTVLLLVTAALMASFSIPADLRNQTIHTIVTKPVERFEIIIGRFLGYTML